MSAGDSDESSCHDQFAKCCELIFGHGEETTVKVETDEVTTEGSTELSTTVEPTSTDQSTNEDIVTESIDDVTTTEG